MRTYVDEEDGQREPREYPVEQPSHRLFYMSCIPVTPGIPSALGERHKQNPGRLCDDQRSLTRDHAYRQHREIVRLSRVSASRCSTFRMDPDLQLTPKLSNYNL